MNVRLVWSIGVFIAAAVAVGEGQTTGPRLPPLATGSVYGPELFQMYCATCHGRDGKGGGPAAEALKVAPPDLTALSRRENGVFPALDPSDARVKARIRSLLAHLQSIQQK